MLIILLMMCLSMTDLGAQTSPEGNPEWLLLPHQISFTGSSASSSLTAASGSPYEVSNAAFDEAGNLLFYAKDRWIYDASHVDIDPYTNGFADTEVAIVPRPGTCDQYYVISLTPFGMTTMALNYVTVTVTGSSVAVSSPIIVPSSINALNQGGIAVSPPNVEMERYLYTAGQDQVDRFRISNAGISFDVNIVDAGDFASYGYGNAQAAQEAELAGNCIAWGSSDDLGAPNAYVAIFNMATGTLDDFLSLPLPDEHLRIAGMEFANRGNRLYVSTFSVEDPIDEEGIYYYDLQENPDEAIRVQVEGGERYSKTHLELARDGRMYLVSQSGLLSHFEVDVNLIQVSSLGLSVNSNQADDIYTLPDQFDYDEYYSSTGYPAALITGLDVNGLSVDPSLPTLPEFFTCNSLTMNTATAGVEKYRIILTQLSGSSTGVKYNSGLLTGTPNTSQNLKALPVPDPATGGLGNRFYLSNSANTGDYRTELQVQNFCETINSESGEFRYRAPSSLAINATDINGEVFDEAISTSNPPTSDFFNCEPILLNLDLTGYEYQLCVFRAYPDGQPAPGMNYSSGWSTTIPTQVDLLALADGSGNDIATPGIYGVEVKLRDECGIPTLISRTGYFSTSASPQAASIALQFSPQGPQPTGGLQPASQTLGDVIVGSGSGSFDLSNSTGLITYYRIDYIDEVDCTTGAFVKNVWTGSNIVLNNPSQLQNIGLNAVTFNPATGFGYFNDPVRQTSGLGLCYEIKVTVGNPCGESSVWSYFTIDPIGNYRLSNASASGKPSFQAVISPNPTAGNVLLRYELPASGTVHFRLFSQDGRLVKAPWIQQVEAGSHQHKVSMADLPTGMYLWQVQSEHGMKTGRLIRR